MAFVHASAGDRAIAEINITPLVDVMLVLLVIFMIATPALTHSLDWQLPQGNPPKILPKTMTLDIQSGDVISLDGQALSRRELATQLAAVAQRDPDVVVKVQVDPEVEYSAAVSAMATARNAGVENISVVSFQ